MYKNKTWELVELPKRRKAIGWRKLKKDIDDNIETYKARLVVRGYAQKSGIDFNKIFFSYYSVDHYSCFVEYGNGA